MATVLKVVPEGSSEKFQLPEIPTVPKLHVFRIEGVYYESRPEAVKALTAQALESFIALNKLKGPAEIATAVAANMAAIQAKVEKALNAAVG